MYCNDYNDYCASLPFPILLFFLLPLMMISRQCSLFSNSIPTTQSKFTYKISQSYNLIIYILYFSVSCAGEITLLKPLDEISAITHIGDPVILTVIAEEVKVARNEPPAMATTVQLALFLPERSNSPPYFENDQ